MVGWKRFLGITGVFVGIVGGIGGPKKQENLSQKLFENKSIYVPSTHPFGKSNSTESKALNISIIAISLPSSDSIPSVQKTDSVCEVGDEASCLERYDLCLFSPPTILPSISLFFFYSRNK